MGPYHILLSHFPIALWVTAAMIIFWRALSDGPQARAFDRTLVALLVFSQLLGVADLLVGLMVWPWESMMASPIGRNHVLMAGWTLMLWAVVLWVRWRAGEAVWEGAARWAMVVLALVGSTLLAITGTLGGHLAGASTGLSALLRALGWEVYRTYYVPDLTVWVLLALAALLVVLGVWTRAGSRANGQ